MVFENEADYDKISLGDDLMIDHAREQVNTGKIILKNKTKNEEYPLLIEVSERQKEMLQAGGLINLMRSKN